MGVDESLNNWASIRNREREEEEEEEMENLWVRNKNAFE